MGSSEELRRVLYQAEKGDLRPQFNPHASWFWRHLPHYAREVEPVLVDRFFQLARPIADGRTMTGSEARLSDVGHFFYLVEALQRIGYQRLTETLLVILDQFLELDENAYNELYLWSIVYLSRDDVTHVDRYWPAAVALDHRFRADDWQRPEGVSLAARPYRFTELLFYYYVICTIGGGSRMPPDTSSSGSTQPKFRSLGACLSRIRQQLSDDQKHLIRHVLAQLAQQQKRVAFRDALGMFVKGK
ncbi:MAG: hypothetical protein KatS3mg105_1233 [Gemmatales bacterium]|nr:MAG: hypothetical protein KatS3mg105_1233 [Gemmatales bacterium]